MTIVVRIGPSVQPGKPFNPQGWSLVAPTFSEWAAPDLSLIGKKASHVPAAKAMDYVFGYVNFIDGSARGMRVSLATVYNTLHQFTRAGLLRQVTVDANRAYFDTNTSDHQHFLFECKTKQIVKHRSYLLSCRACRPRGNEGLAV